MYDWLKIQIEFMLEMNILDCDTEPNAFGIFENGDKKDCFITDYCFVFSGRVIFDLKYFGSSKSYRQDAKCLGT